MRKTTKHSECNHIIGLLHHRDYSELVTLVKLIGHIRKRNEFNDMIRRDPNFNDLQHFMWKEYTLKNYGDFRVSTNLSRFNCCPYCGTEIDWKAIKEHEI